MRVENIQSGTKIQCKNGNVFTIQKATDSRLSWYVEEPYKSGTGRNVLKMTWCTRKQAQKYLDSGWWTIID